LTEEHRAKPRRLCDHEPTITIGHELTTIARERKGQTYGAGLTRLNTSGMIK